MNAELLAAHGTLHFTGMEIATLGLGLLLAVGLFWPSWIVYMALTPFSMPIVKFLGSEMRYNIVISLVSLPWIYYLATRILWGGCKVIYYKFVRIYKNLNSVD